MTSYSHSKNEMNVFYKYYVTEHTVLRSAASHLSTTVCVYNFYNFTKWKCIQRNERSISNPYLRKPTNTYYTVYNEYTGLEKNNFRFEADRIIYRYYLEWCGFSFCGYTFRCSQNDQKVLYIALSVDFRLNTCGTFKR